MCHGLAMSWHHGHAGIERTDSMDTALLEGQGSANAEWQNDVEGLIAVFEAMVSTPGTSTMLFKTAGPQVGQAHLHHQLASPVNVLPGYQYWYSAEEIACRTKTYLHAKVQHQAGASVSAVACKLFWHTQASQ